jgi:phosphoserine aminotransferase
MLDWHGTGMSIMEMGHRDPEFQSVARQAEVDLRELMSIPKNYHVLFVPGGATAQFAMVPINLMGTKLKADYVDTGIWSKKAIDEAKRYGQVNVAAHMEQKDHLAYIPHQDKWKLSADAAYVHYTPNETIDGVEFNWIPETGNIPLVADMSSMILSRPVDVSKYGVIYAGAQKNLGHPGITIVIIRDDLVQEPPERTPTLYKYKLHVEHQSFYNTPPTYSWYFCGLMFDWMKRQGGVAKFYAMNQRKAKKLYDFIDSHIDFYISRIHPECRSMMNVVFTLKNEELINRFLKEASSAGLENLKGHRIAGGARASIYNAMPEEYVDRLIDFMDDFARKNG